MVTVNASEYEIRRAREELAASFGSLDAKRPTAWAQFGWKTDLCFDDYLRAYERGGPGHGAVHRILDKCWQEWPRVKAPGADEESEWEKTFGKLMQSINGWQKLRDFDRRNMVGRYSALIYRVADGQPLSAPLTRGQKLVDIIPVYENQIKATHWDTDQTSPTYGDPMMFQYQRRRLGSGQDTQGQPMDWADVHPSRVQLLAEGSVGDFLDGVPLLKAGFNELANLEKISGGSAEGYLKNSARTLVLKFDANGTPAAMAATPGEPNPAGQAVKDAIEQKTRDLNSNIDSSIVLQGGDATTLQTSMADPAPSFEVSANLFAASVQIPMTVLFGAQTGRLASDEDRADMVARCKSRQRNELTPMLEQFVKRMQAAGLVDAGDFEIEWAPLDAPGDTEKLDNSAKMADINLKAFQAGDGPVFAPNEVRKVCGYEELPGGDDMLTPEEKAQTDAEMQIEIAKAKPAPVVAPPGQKPPLKAV